MIRTVEAYDMMLPNAEDHEKAAEIDLDAIRQMEELEKGAEELSDKFIRQEASIDLVLEKTRRSEYIIRKMIESYRISDDMKGKIKKLIRKKCLKHFLFCGFYV